MLGNRFISADIVAQQIRQWYHSTLPYLAFGMDACTRQTPSAEATAQAQCASPTDPQGP